MIQANDVSRFRRKDIFASRIITLLKDDPSPGKGFTRTEHSHRKRGEVRDIGVRLPVHVEKRNPFSQYNNDATHSITLLLSNSCQEIFFIPPIYQLTCSYLVAHHVGTTPVEITVRLASVGETIHGRPQWQPDVATHRCRNGPRAQCGAVLAHGHVRTPPGFRRSE